MSYNSMKMYSKVWKGGTNTKVITIPSNIVRFLELEEGDMVSAKIEVLKKKKEESRNRKMKIGGI